MRAPTFIISCWWRDSPRCKRKCTLWPGEQSAPCCGLKNPAQPRKIWTSLKIWGVGRKCSVRHQWMGERDAHCLTSRSAWCRGGHWWPSPLCTAYLCSDSQCTTQCTPGCTCSLTRCMPMTCPPPSRYHCTKVHIPPMSCSQPLFLFNVQEPLAKETKNDFQRYGTQPESVSTIHTIPRKIYTKKANMA